VNEIKKIIIINKNGKICFIDFLFVKIGYNVLLLGDEAAFEQELE
jgi:hypothetical protein